MGRKVVYSMHVALDGCVEGPNRELDRADPDAEFHTFVNDQERSAGVYVYGRRLYELMPFIPPLDQPFGLELVDTRRFASGVVYLAYAVQSRPSRSPR